MGPSAARCSDQSRARQDSMIATAPPASHWLLVELEGPWPIGAMGAFPKDVARVLAQRAQSADARISLIRRPGRHPRGHAPIRWAYADLRPGHEGIRWGVAEDAAAVAAADWEVSAGEGEPVVLVCAHSRHDVCCALRGRPVVKTLAEDWPEHVWECSHLGGDRFAATMVLLPHGLCYGRIDPTNAPEVLHAYQRGQVVPELLRGRCCLTRPEQAAQALLRDQGASRDIGALPPLGTNSLGDGLFEVTLGGEPGHIVRLRERVVALGTPATCRATQLAEGREYELLSVTPLPE